MNRREFIGGLAGAATWPIVARAAAARRMKRIGVLNTFAAGDSAAEARIEAFRLELRRLGWISGSNVLLDIRSTANDANLTQKHAAELVGLAPDVILTAGVAGVAPLFKATRSVPIVFVLGPHKSAGWTARSAMPR